MLTGLPLPASMPAISSTLRVREVIGSCPRTITPCETPATIIFMDSARSESDSPSRTRRTDALHFGIAMIERNMCSDPMWSWPSWAAQLEAAFSASPAFLVYISLIPHRPPLAR